MQLFALASQKRDTFECKSFSRHRLLFSIIARALCAQKWRRAAGARRAEVFDYEIASSRQFCFLVRTIRTLDTRQQAQRATAPLD